MPHSRVVSLFVFSVLVTQAGLFGQGVRNAEVSPDDPELYFGLFSLHQAIKASITHTEGKEAAAAKQMAAANEFHISTEDFQGALTVGGLVLQRIASLTREARNYYDSEVGAGRTPDRTVLDGFRQRRAALLQTSVVELRGAMTPAGWAALHTYINEKYRRSIVRQELKRDK